MQKRKKITKMHKIRKTIDNMISSVYYYHQ